MVAKPGGMQTTGEAWVRGGSEASAAQTTGEPAPSAGESGLVRIRLLRRFLAGVVAAAGVAAATTGAFAAEVFFALGFLWVAPLRLPPPLGCDAAVAGCSGPWSVCALGGDCTGSMAIGGFVRERAPAP